jgi:hypothetical protein
MVALGENVMLFRQPNNQYDRNAIQVKNLQNVQVGHVPRETAAALAPLMDRGIVRVEGIVTGRKGAYNLPIQICVYTTAQYEEEVIGRLAGSFLNLVKDFVNPQPDLSSMAAPPPANFGAAAPGGANAAISRQAAKKAKLDLQVMEQAKVEAEWLSLLKRGTSMAPGTSNSVVDKLVMSEKDLEKVRYINDSVDWGNIYALTFLSYV